MSTKFNPLQWLKPNEPKLRNHLEQLAKKASLSDKTDGKFHLLLDAIKEQGTDITENYDEWISIGFAIYNSYGERGKDYFDQISQNHTHYSFEECSNTWTSIVNCSIANGANKDQSKATLQKVFNIAKRHGIDIAKLYNAHCDEAAVNAVKQVVDLRFNNLLERIEFRFLEDDEQTTDVPIDKKTSATGYEPMSERILKTILIRAKKLHNKLTMALLDAIVNSIDVAPNYDPFQEYLDSLPKWTPSQPDYIREFFSFIEFEDEDNTEFYLKYLEKWFVSFVALGMGKINDNQIMPVLIGRQFTGKTYFAKHILPMNLRRYYHTIYPGDKNDKDQQLMQAESLIINFDEFNITSSRSSSIIKATLSSEGGRIRDAYGHFREYHKRHCSFVGTSNEEQYLWESAGDRRFLSVRAKGTKDMTDNPLPYDGAYAQALYLIENNYKFSLSIDDVNKLSQHNEPHVQQDICESLIQVYYRIPTEEETGVFVSVGEIIQKLSPTNPRVNPTNVGKAMTNLGFEFKKPKNVKKYYVMEIKAADRKEQNEKEGKEFHDATYGSKIANDNSADDDPVLPF